MAEMSSFQWRFHIKYFQRCMQMLPSFLSSLDTNRMTLVFFSLSGLDLLDKLPEGEERQAIIDWIYSLQVLPTADHPAGGFRGSTSFGHSFNPSCESCSHHHEYDGGHLAMTYTALASLAILDAPLDRVDRKAVIQSLQQCASGSFMSVEQGGEEDMRFLYCACCICHMLNDWSPVDKPKAAAFVKQSIGYDGGIAQGPGLESHAGSTFCGVAALSMMGNMDEVLDTTARANLVRWLVNRQETGFNGRPNKLIDTCYSFWVGGALTLLDSYSHIDQSALLGFLHETETAGFGGFSKHPDATPDPLHSYMGLAGLCFTDTEGLMPLNAQLNISQRAAKRWRNANIA
eukprot:TRINITY_DN11086_c0_g2_i4.p2 TRINITY_DN11086_c0_g2~~TRINITY_DN11086_c0_g2_i4.p2  ORF type:complete len:345 (+),score=58.81 TRINITY_DN11086_c0_g2_i4:1867-2901(+)